MRARIEEFDEDRDVHIHEVDKADIQIVADHCQALRSSGYVGGKDEKLAMTCDGFTIMQWCNNKGITWQQFFRDGAIQNRFLNDPDNRAFRVWEGRV